MSDSEYGTGSASVKGKGLIVTIDSQKKLSFSYHDASGNNVTEGGTFSEQDPVNPTSISLDPSSFEIEAGLSKTVNVNFAPADTTEKGVAWSSSNTSVATVSNGVVTGVAAGTATITATSTVNTNLKASCNVTVKAGTTVEFVQTDTLIEGNDYLIANGNSGSVYLVSTEANGSRTLKGVAATVTNGKITVNSSVLGNTLFTCDLESSSNANSTRLKNGSKYLYTNNSDGLRMFTLTSEEKGKYWHYKGDGKNLLWFFKGDDGYTDTSSTYKCYLECNSGNFTDNHVSTTSLANSNNLPKMYLFCKSEEQPHQHTYGDPTWTWAEDNSSATATFNCTVGDDTQTVKDEAPVEVEVTAATCTGNKVVKYTAKVTFEGQEYTDETEDITVADSALGHNWSEWKVTRAAAETAEGEGTRTCSRCGLTEKQKIIIDPPGPIPGYPSDKELANAKVDSTLPVINPEKITTTASMSKKTMTIKLGKLNADNCLVEYRQAGANTWTSKWYGKRASQLVITGMKKNGFYQYRFTTVKLVNGQWRKSKPSNTCYRWIRNIKAKKPVAGKKRFTFKWTKVKKAKGYEIQYAANKAFTKNAKKVTVKGAKKTSKTIKGLKKGKTYYVRIRPYTTKSGKKYLGIYTVAKKVKVK